MIKTKQFTTSTGTEYTLTQYGGEDAMAIFGKLISLAQPLLTAGEGGLAELMTTMGDPDVSELIKKMIVKGASWENKPGVDYNTQFGGNISDVLELAKELTMFNFESALKTLGVDTTLGE